MIKAMTATNAHKTGPKALGTNSVGDRECATHNTEHRDKTKYQLMNHRAASVQSVGVALRRGAYTI